MALDFLILNPNGTIDDLVVRETSFRLERLSNTEFSLLLEVPNETMVGIKIATLCGKISAGISFDNEIEDLSCIKLNCGLDGDINLLEIEKCTVHLE